MCDGHKRCTRHPVFVVKLHRMDRCNRPRSNAEYELCPACVRAAAYRIVEALEDNADVLPLRCKTCERMIGNLHDMFDVEYVTGENLRQAQ